MSIKIELAGLFTPGGVEERTLAKLKVEYNDNVYDWEKFVPVDYQGRWDEFITDFTQIIQNEIDAKEAEWEALEPKTRTIESMFLGEEPQEVTIDKSEIVRPDIPDYYAKRRAEYPKLGDQLDAIWKGPNSPEYQNIMDKIAEIKQKYPK